MTAVTLEEAQARLRELVEQLRPGEEVVILQDERPVARLVADAPPARRPRQPGSARGQLVILAEDEDHLEDFKDYMP